MQGGLLPDLRKKCAEELLKRETRGVAVGGLSGGESKDEFWKTVHLCTNLLAEKDIPRYLMGKILESKWKNLKLVLKYISQTINKELDSHVTW